MNCNIQCHSTPFCETSKFCVGYQLGGDCCTVWYTKFIQIFVGHNFLSQLNQDTFAHIPCMCCCIKLDAAIAMELMTVYMVEKTLDYFKRGYV